MAATAAPAQPVLGDGAEEGPEMSPSQKMVDWILTHPLFDPVMSTIIFLNFVVVLMETDFGAACADDAGVPIEGCMPDWVDIVNMLLLVIYTIEIAARMYAYRLALRKNYWALFDLFIVVVGYVDLILTAVMKTAIPGMGMLRIFRCARLLRAARVLQFFPTLNTMLRGFLNAMTAMWMGFLGIIVLIIMWSVLIVNFVHPTNRLLPHDEGSFCKDAFSSIWNCIVLLFQTLVAGDSWGSCAIPVVLHSPIMMVFFAGTLITIQLGFTNLILATIVERASEASEMDKQEKMELIQKKRREAQEHLESVCVQLDTDEDGKLSFDDLMAGFDENPEFQACLMELDIERTELTNLFTLMDEDESGDLTYGELIQTIEKSHSRETGRQVMMLQMEISKICKQLKAQDRAVDCIGSMLQAHTGTEYAPGRLQAGLAAENVRKSTLKEAAVPQPVVRAPPRPADNEFQLSHSADSIVQELRLMEQRINRQLSELYGQTGRFACDFPPDVDAEKWKDPQTCWGVIQPPMQGRDILNGTALFPSLGKDPSSGHAGENGFRQLKG